MLGLVATGVGTLLPEACCKIGSFVRCAALCVCMLCVCQRLKEKIALAFVAFADALHFNGTCVCSVAQACASCSLPASEAAGSLQQKTCPRLLQKTCIGCHRQQITRHMDTYPHGSNASCYHAGKARPVRKGGRPTPEEHFFS